MANGPYRPAMIPWDEYRYVVYARRFGWTPDQVDNLPLDAEPWILPIASAIDEEEARRMPKPDGKTSQWS